jgi:hypothetical protein
MGAPAKKVKKAVKKATKFVDKKIVEPLERPVKKVIKKVDKAVVEPLERPVKKVIKKVEKAVVEPVEKVYKKAVTEVKDTVAGTDKTDRQPPTAPQTAQARTGAPREQTEDAPTGIETSGTQMKRRRKGKKALVLKQAAAQVGGEGGSGLNIPKG